MVVQVLQEKTREDEGSCRKYPLIVLEAIDLYKRGLNVFPVPRPEAVMKLAIRYPEHYEAHSKIPYIQQPLFYSRMHLCGWNCREKTQRTGTSCSSMGKPYQFEYLFYNTNLAVMLGRTSKNLICIDCDDPDAFVQCLHELESRGLPFWAYVSSRGGNILFCLKEGEGKNTKNSTIKNVEIWGNHHYCILPPSLHPKGIIYTWVDDIDPRAGLQPYEGPPLLSIKQVEWLGIKLVKNNHAQNHFPSLPQWTEVLSIANRKILTSKIHEGERNTLLTKVIYDIAAAIQFGYTSEDEASQLLYTAANNCVPPYPRNQIDKMLTSALSKPGLELSKNYLGNFRKQRNNNLNNPFKIYQAYPWHSLGRNGLIDKAVFSACIRRAQLDCSLTFRASSREIASLANLQKHQTALKSLNRLCNLRLLIPEGKDKSGANCYSFGDPDIERTTINTNNSSGPSDDTSLQNANPTSQPEKDVFSSLGRVPYSIWKHLLRNPERTKADIARNCSHKPSSVHSALKRLQAYKLVIWSSAEGLYIGKPKDDAEMIAIAQLLHVDGRSEKRDFRFQRDREIKVNQKILRAKIFLFNRINSEGSVIDEN